MHLRFLNASSLIAIFSLLTGAGSAFAHEGHGLEGSHWHPTDVWGFIAMGALVALALWLSKRDK
jgi:hypothetical protein